MKLVLEGIIDSEKNGKKLLAVLIDPEKFNAGAAKDFLRKLPASTTHILIGGSTATSNDVEVCTKAVKSETDLPVILFPGDYRQITKTADALLFLSLLSGRNPEYLIEQQVKSVPLICKSQLEVIPTGYLLIDGGKESAVQRVSGTHPIPQEEVRLIIETALAGKYSGKKLIYLEAGSGAEKPVCAEIISEVKQTVDLPLLVGGGIKNPQQLAGAYAAGADMVIIGTAFEEDRFFGF